MSSSEYARTRGSPQERLALLRAQSEDTPVPGMLAYVDSIPVGWCGFGVREQMMRLVKSRTIPATDGVGVWSIVCFSIRVGYRRRGLARELLHGVIDYAREHGAPALEAYPIDPDGRRVHATAAQCRNYDALRRRWIRARG